ncbi:unnamed protein product, partial [Chrysoparadoxa australica]
SFGGTDPRGLSTYTIGAHNVSTTLEDNQDGSDNGVIAPGDAFSWTATGNTSLIGVTDAGYPVLFESGPNYYYILSNNGNLFATPLSISDTSYTMCFAAGTLITTGGGTSTVETLKIGDEILDQNGRAVPIKWIGRQTLNKLFASERMRPVRIRTGALGDGLPHSDLTVTADHGMILDGLVINASALVNGSTIDFVPLAELPDSFTVYHIETETHDVILANGAPSETFIDYRDRRAFDNFDEYLDLYGAERIIPEMHRPRISSARLLPQLICDKLKISAPLLDLAKSA